MTIALLALLALAAPAEDGLEPVTVAVVDSETGGPVTSLRYRFYFEAPGRAAPGDRAWTSVESPSGTFTVRVPRACKLHLTVKGRDYLGGRGMYHEFVIRSTDDPRRVSLKLTPGITVRGTVRDAATNAPIAGAKVRPISPTGPHQISLDEEWAVETDKEGRYELHGVDPEGGVSASHPDYGWEKDDDRPKGTGPRREILLPPGDVLRGTVRDASGKPLGGVDIVDGLRHRTRTDPDGSYTLRNPGWALKFRKEGYIPRELSGGDEARKAGGVVVLEPQFALEGRVVAADGRPVEAFTVSAGPGRFPKDYECAHRDATDRAGRFALGLDQPGLHWVGVRAAGYAAWEGTAAVARGGRPLSVRLEPGVTVVGRIVAPARGGGTIRAALAPRRDKTDHGGLPASHTEEFATLSATVGPDGALRFEHVRPDRYLLDLDGPTITPARLALDVPPEGLDLGAIRLDGRGRVAGRVFLPEDNVDAEKPWDFAPGIVLWPASGWRREIEFRAGEDGRFDVEGVPAGMVRVGFQYQIFDVIHSHVWAARVVEGRTTEVHAFEPGRSRPLAIRFDVGDGTDAQSLAGSGRDAKRLVDNITRKPSYFLDDAEKAAKTVATRPPLFFPELQAHSREPLSFSEPDWAEPDARRQIVLPDVAPGAYRLRVLDWLGSADLTDGLLLDEDITVAPDKPIRIPLGAGCITGKCPKNDDYHRPVVVVATPRGGKGPSRRSRCDGDGNFCVRYLAPGRYTLRALDPALGWARVDDVAVGVGATDVGELRMQSGGTLAASIAFRRPGPVPDEVVATDAAGIALTARFEVYSSFDRVTFRGLWPGRWAVAFRSGGEAVASGVVTLAGAETARLELATEAGVGP